MLRVKEEFENACNKASDKEVSIKHLEFSVSDKSMLLKVIHALLNFV